MYTTYWYFSKDINLSKNFLVSSSLWWKHFGSKCIFFHRKNKMICTCTCKKLKYCVLDKEVQWIYVHHFSNCSWIHNGSFWKVMPGTKKRENSIIILLALAHFAWLFELKLAVKYQKQFLIPFPLLFIFKDFTRARDQKYREIVYLSISYV